MLEKALRVLKEPVCDHCLGRQFGQLLSGTTNEERGRALRMLAAMAVDREKGGLDGIHPSNLAGIPFHYLRLEAVQGPCSVCNGLFASVEAWVRKAARAAKRAQFSTFVVGTRLSHDMVEKEEALWERAGIEHCEPIKAEINREVGKRLETALGAKADTRNPDVAIMLDLSSGKASLVVHPLFIYGEYQKLVRGIPQTKWPSGKYRTSVEQIIAKPFMAATKAKEHKLHGLGREDIDARCLAWRPFVLELVGSKVRKIDIRRLGKKAGKGVKVRNLRVSSIAEVRAIKEARIDKTYRALVSCERDVSRKQLAVLSSITEIRQRTPARVMHRRADKVRKRHVRKLRAMPKTKNTFVLTVTAEAGTYIKELVSGDNGRTEPSVSSLLGTPCTCAALDVVGIHMPKKARVRRIKKS